MLGMSQNWELLLFSLHLGKSLLHLLSGLFPQITGHPLSSSERPGLHRRLWAGADQGLVPTEIEFPAPQWSQVNTGETARLPQLPTNNQIPEATTVTAAHPDCVWLQCPGALLLSFS